MKVADYIINRLADEGIKEMFEVYGSATGDLVDAFTRTNKTRYISAKVEEIAGFAAEGHAKISGNPGVALSTSGPGAQSFLKPIGNFFYDSVPGIFLTGNVDSRYQRPDPSIRQVGFQESPIVESVKPMAKYAKMITDPNTIKYELEKALFIAQESRPGPALLDIPLNMQKAEINPDELFGFDTEIAQPAYHLGHIDRKIESFLEDLSKAERPAMLIGGGVRTSGGIEELLALGQKLKIPMFPTWNALDVVTDDNPYFGGRIGTYGGKGRNFGIQNSDLLLSIGSRISGRLYGSKIDSFLRGAKKYLVDVDQALLQKFLQPVKFDECIHSDAKLFLERLNEALDSIRVPDFSSWMSQVTEWRDKYDPVDLAIEKEKEIDFQFTNPYRFFRTLSQEMGSRDILVGDCGGNIVNSNHAFETKQGQRNITNNGNSPMGFAVSGAIGAWLASDKTQNTVCTIGDGGFDYNLSALGVIRNYNIGMKTFIINNHVYGITKAFQTRRFEGRFEGCGPKGYNPPDFRKIVSAHDIAMFTIDSNEEAREVIRSVLEFEGPAVCDVNCHEWCFYAPSVSGGLPIEDTHPRLPRSEFKQNMIIPPVDGWDK